MTKRTTDETRQLLLDTGMQLLHARGAYVGVTHIRLSDVVDAAHLTTGAAYRIWENQDCFHRELAVAAVRLRSAGSVDGTVASIRAAVDAHAPLGEVIRLAAPANLHRYPDDVAYLTSLILRTTSRVDPDLLLASVERHRDAMAGFGQLYQAMLDVYGRRMRPAFSVEHMTAALAALSEGFAMQTMSGVEHPEIHRCDVGPGIGQAWTLFGCAAEAIVEHFTEPVR